MGKHSTDDEGNERIEYRDWGVLISLVEKNLKSLQPGEAIELSLEYSDGKKLSFRRYNMRPHALMIIGLALIVCSVFLAFYFENPTAIQVKIIISLLSLGGGAFGSEIPGILKVKLTIGKQLLVGATGAAAIFVILFFWIPAT